MMMNLTTPNRLVSRVSGSESDRRYGVFSGSEVERRHSRGESSRDGPDPAYRWITPQLKKAVAKGR